MKNRVRQFRESRKLTVEGLAELAGCSKATISLIENGKRVPSMAMLESIATALNVPARILLSDSDIPDEIASEIADHISALFNLTDRDRAAVFALTQSLRSDP
jgi:transcriptional regulator with XRE-family HTH domain